MKLKLQYFGHLIQRADSLENTLMLGKTESKKRRGQQRMRWSDSINDSMDMDLSKLWEMVKDQKAWPTTVHGIAKSRTRLSDWTTNWSIIDLQCCVSFRFTAKWSSYTYMNIYIYIYIYIPENGLKWSCFEVDWPSKTILYWFEMTCHFTSLPWGLKERAGGTVLSFGKSKRVLWPKVQASPSMWGLKFRQRKRTLGTSKRPKFLLLCSCCLRFDSC